MATPRQDDEDGDKSMRLCVQKMEQWTSINAFGDASSISRLPAIRRGWADRGSGSAEPKIFTQIIFRIVGEPQLGELRM